MENLMQVQLAIKENLAFKGGVGGCGLWSKRKRGEKKVLV